MMFKATALILWIWTSCLTLTAAVDCNQQQNYFQAFKDCCKVPIMNFDGFKEKCHKFMPDVGLRASPCLYDCIFNSENVLNGTTNINESNARLMMHKFLGNNEDLVDIYTEGLQNCTGSVDEMNKFFKRRAPGMTGAEKCSHLPVMYGICAQRYVFNHCPPAKWTHTQNCEMAREYLLNCPIKKARGSG